MAKAKKMKSKGEVLTAAMAARIINPQTMEVQHG